MRYAAEVKSRGERVEIIMFHRVVNILDALVRVAVVVSAGGSIKSQSYSPGGVVQDLRPMREISS